MAGWHPLSAGVTLFDDWAREQAYGWIGGSGGRIMLGLLETSAQAKLRTVLRRKLAKGYRSARP
jgi:hypothetical protein